MKVFKILSLALLISTSVLSNSILNEFCQESIKVEGSQLIRDDIKFHQGIDRLYIYGKSHSSGNFVGFYKNGSRYSIPSRDEVIDLKEVGERIFILSFDTVLVLDKTTLIPLNAFSTTDTYIEHKHQMPREIEVIAEKIYVAHGSLGISEIDMTTNTRTEKLFELPHAKNHLSAATGIAVDRNENKVYIAYDNVTYDFGKKTRAFEGLVIADKSLNKLKAISIKQNREALHEPSLELIDGMLYSQNLDFIFVYPTKKLMRARKLWPKRRLFSFTNKSQLMSQATISNGKVKGCFSKYDPSTGSFLAFFDEFIPKL